MAGRIAAPDRVDTNEPGLTSACLVPGEQRDAATRIRTWLGAQSLLARRM